MDVLFGYKTMPEWHKNNLKSYCIYDGIFTVSPDISDEDAKLIFELCEKNMNDNINPFTISHFITDEFTKGNLTREELENAKIGDLAKAAFYDNLNYYKPIIKDETREVER